MANVKTAEVARNAALSAIADLLMTGGFLEIWSGSRPATPETTATGTLLAQLPLAAPAFTTPTGGTLTAFAVSDAAILATDTAGYCRITNLAGDGLIDGDVGLPMSGAFVELSSLSFVSSVTLSVTSLTLNIPIGS